MKKISISVLLVSLVLTFFPAAKAQGVGNILIRFSVQGGDGNFTVLANDFDHTDAIPQSFTVSTSQGFGMQAFTVPANRYYFHLQDPVGWQLLDNYCYFSYLSSSATGSNGLDLYVAFSDSDTVTCTYVLKKQTKTPVLIVLGIMGTDIKKGSDLLWADATRMLNPFSSDSFMDPLMYKVDGNPLDTSLELGGVISVKLTFNYTKDLLSSLSQEGYVEGRDLYLFPYDWRRDIHDVAVTADQTLQNMSLKQIIDQILLSTGSSKIDIVAHSQGGLVVKRLLYEMPEYRAKMGKLLFVGVPNLGSAKATKVLLYGDNMDIAFMGLGLDPQETKKISQNMPSVYELLPSREYFNHSNSYLGKADTSSGLLHVVTLDKNQSDSFLKDSGLNSSLVDLGNIFHAQDYDNLDLAGSGAQLFNIVGCQTGTYGKIAIKPDGSFSTIPVAGDGTVPLFSASNIPGAKIYFALNSSHGTMLTQEGIRQQIVNLLAGTNLATNGSITENSADCQFSGTAVSVHSPVDLHIYNSLGQHVGPTQDGGFDYEIPNVGYDVIGHEKFAFIPEGSDSTVKLVATDNGEFSFDSTKIVEGQINNTAHYDSIPVTSTSTAEILLDDSNDQNIVFTSEQRVVPPSAVLDGLQLEDTVPPVSASSLSGQMGQAGVYRSDVEISLSASDAQAGQNSDQVSGVLKTVYSLDGAAVYSEYSEPVKVLSEGHHNITFFLQIKPAIGKSRKLFLL